MEQYTKKRHSSFGLVLFYSLIITAAAQINISLYQNYFKISIAVILIPIFFFFLERFPLMGVSILSAVGIFLSRSVVQIIYLGTSDKLIVNFIPETCFYLVYGMLLFLYCRKSSAPFVRIHDFAVLICIDYMANLTELLLRPGIHPFILSAQASILLAAVFRSGTAFLIVTAIKHSHLILLKQEHTQRYQNLLLLISKLNGEILWMKKNTALMETTMNTSYKLYKDLFAQGAPEALTDTALQTAKDIHEIKKEYFIILKGISDALELNLKDEGMHIADLLKLLTDTFRSSENYDMHHTELLIQCTPHLFTERHYFLLSVFHNLFTNALEACSSVSETKISCIQSEDASYYIFTVADNGPGIPKEDQKEIFHPGFSTKINYQTGEVSRGLGLNLVLDLIENQFHGKIELSSVPGQTVFSVFIPKSELKVVL